MHQNGARVQESQPIKRPKFFPRQLVNSFTGMHDEGASPGCARARRAKIAAKSHRMPPAVLGNYFHWKILPCHLRTERIVMTHCCDSAKEVPNAAPPYTYLFRHSSMLCDHIWEFFVYV